MDERIPVAGEHEVTPDEVRDEGIPLPANLRLQREIGRGVAGRIHPAIDRNLLRPVALKRLAKELATSRVYRDGFIAEAQITGQLEHPSIVPVHELGVSPEGVPYFTMKLVYGVGFDAWLRAHPTGTTGSATWSSRCVRPASVARDPGGGRRARRRHQGAAAPAIVSASSRAPPSRARATPAATGRPPARRQGRPR